MIPKLNQVCTISERSIDHRGTKTYYPVAHNIPCRFGRLSSTVETGEGETNKFNAYLHMGFDYEVNKGMIIDFCDKLYQIESVTKTPNLNGDYFMQYCELTEIYAD